MPLPSAYISRLKFSRRGLHVTILAPGRGGVDGNGKLNSVSRHRVRLTLHAARALQDLGCEVLIIWMGYKNLSQVKHNVSLGDAGSEGQAYMDFAKTEMKLGDISIMHMAETESTTTIAGFAFVAKHVPIDSLVFVITDRLHFMYGRVRFAAQLMFPGRTLHLYEMGFKFTRGRKFMQAVSTFVTRLGMIGVERGDKDAVLKRQARLERWTNWLLGR